MISEILRPGTHLYQAEDFETRCYAEGEDVVIHAQGKFRTAEIVKEGPKRITTIRENPNTGRRFVKAVPRAEVYLLDGLASEFVGYIQERAGRGPRGQHLERED